MDEAGPGFDTLLDGQLRLRQPATGHRAGTDAILLAASVAVKAGASVVDAGAGVGTVGLALALREPSARMTLVELSAMAAGLAGENIGLNGLEPRATLVLCDLLQPKSRRAAGLLDGQADIVVTNPPFYKAGQVRVSANAARAAAHVLEPGGLARWIAACLALLRPGGQFAMIHRPEALAEILQASEGRMGAITLYPVFPRAGMAAHRMIVRGKKGSRAPPGILPGLVLHGADGAFTPEAEAVHRGAALLPGLG